MQNVIILNVIMLSVVMLSVVILNVVAPLRLLSPKIDEGELSEIDISKKCVFAANQCQKCF